jgi:hypothetical protein
MWSRVLVRDYDVLSTICTELCLYRYWDVREEFNFIKFWNAAHLNDHSQLDAVPALQGVHQFGGQHGLRGKALPVHAAARRARLRGLL